MGQQVQTSTYHSSLVRYSQSFADRGSVNATVGRRRYTEKKGFKEKQSNEIFSYIYFRPDCMVKGSLLSYVWLVTAVDIPVCTYGKNVIGFGKNNSYHYAEFHSINGLRCELLKIIVFSVRHHNVTIRNVGV